MINSEPYIGMPINLSDYAGMPMDSGPVILPNQKAKPEPVVAAEANEPGPVIMKKQPMEDKNKNIGIVVGMAYVPWQSWQTPYNYEKGFSVGTIFPDLNLPFLGYREV